MTACGRLANLPTAHVIVPLLRSRAAWSASAPGSRSSMVSTTAGFLPPDQRHSDMQMD